MTSVQLGNAGSGRRSGWGALGVLALWLALLGLWLAEPLPVHTLRNAWLDQLQRWHPRVRDVQDSPVLVVDIDEASLQTVGQWPWPRTQLASLVQTLQRCEALAIGLDILLAEPDRTSPQTMARLWRAETGPLSGLLKKLPDHDQVLAKAMVGAPVVLGVNLLPAQAEGGPRVEPGDLPYRLVHSGEVGVSLPTAVFGNTVWPLPSLRTAAAGLGAMNFVTDGDGVVRRVPVVLAQSGVSPWAPTLSAELLRVAQGARNHLVRSDAAGLQEVRVGAVTVPVNHRGEIWLHYARPDLQAYLPAWRVLQEPDSCARVQGRVVLVGTSAAGLMDLRFNPLGQSMPGVEAHAQALEHMVSGHYLQRPAWTLGAELLLMALGGLGAGLLALVASAWASALGALVLAGLALGGSVLAFVSQGLLLDAAWPVLAVALCWGLGGGLRHWGVERQQRWIQQAFSRYVSPNRVAHLMAHPDDLALGGRRQTCSFVFTDLAGFTGLMERMDPGDAVRLLNEYLDGMIAVAFAHQGTLDRIVGDAVAIVFSAPLPQPDHAQRALDCAMAMDRFATAYQARVEAAGGRFGKTRIGVHTGEVIVGNFGGSTMFDYRALGDPVNTAARLESVNKHLGTRLCASAAVWQASQGVVARPVGHLVLKGKQEALAVVEPLPDAADLPVGYAPLAMYEAAMAALTPGALHDPPLARQRFAALAQAYPHDPLVQLHARRLQDGAEDDHIVMNEK